MHVLGQVFIWMIAAGALAATVLTAKTYDVRNSWIKKVDQLKERTEAQKPEIAQKEAELKKLQEEFHQTMLGWGDYWRQVGGQLILQGQNPGMFVTNKLGRARGLGAVAPAAQGQGQAQPAPQSPPIVYVFQKDAQTGTSKYVGAYQLDPASLGDNNAAFYPTWTVRPSDFEGIDPGGDFRLRTMVPSHFTSMYANIRGEMIITERLLADKQAALQDQIQQDQMAQDILDLRTNQLKGDPNFAGDPNAPLDKTGLVAQMEAAEDVRNMELAELDRWRRRVNKANLEMQNLLKENRELEQQLEQAATPEKPAEPEVASKITSR